jgi:hypothetical protein
MDLLCDVGQMEAHFGLFEDSVVLTNMQDGCMVAPNVQ